MKFFLAKNEPFTFIYDSQKGKWGHFTMKYEVDERDLDEFDKRISDVFRKMVDRYPCSNASSTSRDMGVMLNVREEPERMCKGKVILGREEEFLKDIAALYHEGNLRVKLTLSFPQTSNTAMNTDILDDVTFNYVSTKEMVVNFEKPNRPCAVGSVLFSNADTAAQFLVEDISINAFITYEVMLDTEYLRPPTKTKNDGPCPEEKKFYDQINFDLTITAASGRQIKCHKSVLSACSPVFRAMLTTDMVEAKTHNIDIPEMSEIGVKSFLDYIYCWNQDVPTENCDIAFELLNAAHKYNVTPDLETAMTTLILSKPSASDWFNVNAVVNIFMVAENIAKYKDALKQKAIQILKENSTTLRNSETYVQMFQKHPAEAMELCELLFGRLSGKPVDIKRRRRSE